MFRCGLQLPIYSTNTTTHCRKYSTRLWIKSCLDNNIIKVIHLIQGNWSHQNWYKYASYVHLNKRVIIHGKDLFLENINGIIYTQNIKCGKRNPKIKGLSKYTSLLWTTLLEWFALQTIIEFWHRISTKTLQIANIYIITGLSNSWRQCFFL